ncbi:unnamed protein product [Allacma fusca]|uniref:Histone acetyltransferase type B catalytic subunit n=1 Tax=Allacma fusca TaxID=39272 RepID=A0A8J2KUB7_9HEXA|nr:unnamed protein product [Allacma fusca]
MEGHPKISDRTTDLEKFVADGNSVVHFQLVRTAEDLRDDKGTFHPAMCHQIFNEQETIFGYENLRIDIKLAAGSLKTYLGIKYTSKISADLCDGVEPDNIHEKLDEVLAPNYLTNFDDFSACISTETEAFRPLGELVSSFTWLARNEKQLPEEREPTENGGVGTSRNGSKRSNGVNRGPVEKTFVIYACEISDPKFLAYVIKMEEFLLWFVDAASFIDQQDEKWKFFVMYEKYKTSEGNDAYAFVGYSTVYNFFAYPANIRPRVSQMLILPPFQRQGLGVNLLSTVYKYYRADARVKEITVEDPSDDFEMLRDYVDAKDCLKLQSYSVDNLKKGFSEKMLEETSKHLKMTKRQSRRMFELLRLRSINVNNDKEFKEYRLDVKRRLNIPYQKQENDIKRMIRRKCNSVELQQAAQIDDASRKTELQSNFQNLYQHYQNIINRLDKFDN